MSGSSLSPQMVDASIPLQAGKGVPALQNPLESLGKFATIQNALNQNKYFPGQMQLQGQAIDKGALDLSQQHNTAAAAWMAPFLALPPEQQTRAALTDMAARGEAHNGIATGGFMNSVAGIGAPDGAAFAAAVAPHIIARAQPSEKAVGAISPAQISIDNGLGIQPSLRPAPGMPGQGGVTPVGPQIPVFPSRAAQMGRIPGPPGPNGEQTSVPIGPVTPPSLTGLPMGSGRIRDTLPPGLQNPNAPPMPGPIPGQITTGLGPAQTNAMAATGAAAPGRFKQISDEGVSARDQTALLANLQNDLTKFTPGPGADYSLFAKKAFQVAVPSSIFGVPFKESVAAQESFRKIANQLADAQGAGSDARLQVNQGANPSDHLSPESADFIVKQLYGNADYRMARARLASQFSNQADPQGFEAQIGAKLDPRYFQYNRLSGDQKADYLAGIKDSAERSAFKRGYGSASAAGYLGRPNGG